MIKASLLSLKYGLQAAIGHEGHDDVWGGASIQTHSCELEDIRMVKPSHFGTLFQ